MEKNPRVGCPYLTGETSDTFAEGFQILGKNLGINNASEAGTLRLSYLSSKSASEDEGSELKLFSDGKTQLVTFGTDPDLLFKTTGTGDLTLDSVGDVVLQAAGGDVISNAQFTLTQAANDQFLVQHTSATTAMRLDVDNDGSVTLDAYGSVPDLELTTTNSEGASTGSITLDATNQIVLESAGGNITADACFESSVSAGAAVFKFIATSDTPTVTFGQGGPTNPSYVMSAAPAGYLEVDVGGSARYLPFWA